MTTLILIPVRPDLHPGLKAHALHLAQTLQGETEIVIDDRPWDVGVHWPWPRRIEAQCALRQTVLEAHLKPAHTAVLWVDADIIAYAPDLLTRLEALGPENVGAPAVLLDRWRERFYDIGGFLEERGGTPAFARMAPPWFDQPGPVVDLVSVGCVYRVPADVYREGRRRSRWDARCGRTWRRARSTRGCRISGRRRIREGRATMLGSLTIDATPLTVRDLACLSAIASLLQDYENSSANEIAPQMHYALDIFMEWFDPSSDTPGSFFQPEELQALAKLAHAMSAYSERIQAALERPR
jgi:hypothetical protein